MTQSHQPADSIRQEQPCPQEAGSLHRKRVLAVKQTGDSHSYQYIHSSKPATAEGPMQPIQKTFLEITALVIREKVCAALSHRLFPT